MEEIKKILSKYGLNIPIAKTKEKGVNAKIMLDVKPETWSIIPKKLYINPKTPKKVLIRTSIPHEIAHYLTEKEFVENILRERKPTTMREIQLLREIKGYQHHGAVWKRNYRLLRRLIKSWLR